MNTTKNCGKMWILATAMTLVLATEAKAQAVLCFPPAPPLVEVVPPTPPIPPISGPGFPVFDAANTAVNSVTANRMVAQVINSERQIALQKRNLVATGGCWEDTGRFLGLLDEVLQYKDGLYYLRPQPGQALDAIYFGFAEVPPWWEIYPFWSGTTLNTLSGTLETVHYQLRPEQQIQEQALLEELKAKTQGALGNLDVSQTGNMITLQIVEEQRKLRQMLGATMNAQNVAAAHAITMEAAAQRIEHDWLERSVAEASALGQSRGYGMSNFGPRGQGR
jgi:hypothetical protein